jgi:hypothetical protein
MWGSAETVNASFLCAIRPEALDRHASDDNAPTGLERPVFVA